MALEYSMPSFRGAREHQTGEQRETTDIREQRSWCLPIFGRPVARRGLEIGAWKGQVGHHPTTELRSLLW
ncbi:hypothetical protein VTK56DRAFT_3499 [Thermocarpiscus australiensis]